MKKNYLFLLLAILLLSCKEDVEIDPINPENWSKRKIDIASRESMEYGKSYLSIYSEIYSIAHRNYNLTSMVSLRNTSDADTIFLLKAEYFDSHGKTVRTYFDYPIFLAPLETTEIIITSDDMTGGTGSNFIFEWKIPTDCPPPLFEAITTSNFGQHGYSFSTQATRIR